jgi:predicted  nucleic acid-binding Zn-ribbon protein
VEDTSMKISSEALEKAAKKYVEAEKFALDLENELKRIDDEISSLEEKDDLDLEKIKKLKEDLARLKGEKEVSVKRLEQGMANVQNIADSEVEKLKKDLPKRAEAVREKRDALTREFAEMAAKCIDIGQALGFPRLREFIDIYFPPPVQVPEYKEFSPSAMDNTTDSVEEDPDKKETREAIERAIKRLRPCFNVYQAEKDILILQMELYHPYFAQDIARKYLDKARDETPEPKGTGE